MKRLILVLSLIMIFFSKVEKNKIDYLNRMTINDTLTIEYIAGDESTEFNKIEINKTRQGLFVKRKGKLLYVGNKAEKDWLKPITERSKKHNKFKIYAEMKEICLQCMYGR